MGKNTSWGNKAYRETRANGGSKEESKQASQRANQLYHEKIIERQFGKLDPNHDNDLSDFNNSINDGSWHTSDDL